MKKVQQDSMASPQALIILAPYFKVLLEDVLQAAKLNHSVFSLLHLLADAPFRK